MLISTPPVEIRKTMAFSYFQRGQTVADLHMGARPFLDKSLMTSRSRVPRVTELFNVVQTFQSARVGL